MSGQVSRRSAREYQADERAGVAGLSGLCLQFSPELPAVILEPKKTKSVTVSIVPHGFAMSGGTAGHRPPKQACKDQAGRAGPRSALLQGQGRHSGSSN